MSLSKWMAKFIISTKYEDLPADVTAFTKLCILDWLGSALAGREKAPIRMIEELVRDSGGNEQASLITGGKSSVVQAALLNGSASHIVELDDIHKASIIHAGTVVIPAALAIGEWKRLSGKDLITAVAVGYDICYRIGEAVSPSHYYYWHNTATCGTFGAAAAAIKLLGLNEEQAVMALGSAGTQAAGLWEFIEDGAMSKQLHTGKAAMNGVMSALLAQKGFTAATRILEGNRGFMKAMSTEYDESKITRQLGREFKIVENSFKIHASCRHTHHVVDLIQGIAAQIGHNPKIVKKIRIQTYQTVLDITDNPNPATLYAAKFSVQFCAALAMIHGKAGLHDFNGQTLQDERIRELMKRIEAGVDKRIDQQYPRKWGAKVEVQLETGEVIVKETEYPKGDPENPVTGQDLIEKFKQITFDLPQPAVDRFIDTVTHLERCPDLSNFLTIEKWSE